MPKYTNTKTTEHPHRISPLPPRNDLLYDTWSLVHLATGIAFGWLMSPLIGLVIMILWEPLEVLILSPILMKRGIIFGHESIRNSLSDIFFDTVGVLLGFYLLTAAFDPPFHLF
jgi:hypothetical protein